MLVTGEVNYNKFIETFHNIQYCYYTKNNEY